MASKQIEAMTKPPHRHVIYNLRCNSMSMKTYTEIQSNRLAIILHKGKDYSSYVEQSPTDIAKRASDRGEETITKQVIPLSSMLPVDLRSYKDKFFKEDDINRSFTRMFVPTADVHETLDNIQEQITDKITSNTVEIAKSDIDGIFHKGRQKLDAKVMESRSEISHTRWLFDCVSKALDGQSYTVKTQQPNLKNIGNNIIPQRITEYATSKADLVIHRLKNLVTNKEGEVENVSGLVVEVKEDDDTDYPIWECYKNMTAVAASLTLQVLQQGALVNRVTVYGIVPVVRNMDGTRLTKLMADFVKGKVDFCQAEDTYPLHLLLNAVVGNIT